MPYTFAQSEVAVPKTARIFLNNRSQAVRLPKEFQFTVDEVFIRREGEDVILSPRPASWDDYLDHGPVAPADFMEGVEDLPLQARPSLEARQRAKPAAKRRR